MNYSSNRLIDIIMSNNKCTRKSFSTNQILLRFISMTITSWKKFYYESMYKVKMEHKGLCVRRSSTHRRKYAVLLFENSWIIKLSNFSLFQN